MKQLQPLCAQVRRHERHSGDITPGMGETCDNAGTDRIATGGKDNWDFLRCPLGSKDRGRTRGDDQIDFVLHQFRCKIGKAIEVTIGIKVFGFDVATLDVTKLAHPESIFFEKAVPLYLRRRYEPSDPRGLSGMLLGGGARHTKRNCAERHEKRPTVPHCGTSW